MSRQQLDLAPNELITNKQWQTKNVPEDKGSKWKHCDVIMGLALRVSTVLQHCVPFSIHFVYSIHTVPAPCLRVRPLRLVKMLHDLGFVFVVAVIVAIILHSRCVPHSICECKYSV